MVTIRWELTAAALLCATERFSDRYDAEPTDSPEGNICVVCTKLASSCACISSACRLALVLGRLTPASGRLLLLRLLRSKPTWLLAAVPGRVLEPVASRLDSLVPGRKLNPVPKDWAEATLEDKPAAGDAASAVLALLPTGTNSSSQSFSRAVDSCSACKCSCELALMTGKYPTSG
jgi:hypothetical protein